MESHDNDTFKLNYQVPTGWAPISYHGNQSWVPQALFWTWHKQEEPSLYNIDSIDGISVIDVSSDTEPQDLISNNLLEWYEEIRAIEKLKEQRVPEEVLEVYGTLLCKSLSPQVDCTRPIGDDQSHHFHYLTNKRTCQIFCTHDTEENALLNQLFHHEYRTEALRRGKSNWFQGEDRAYEADHSKLLAQVLPYLVCETPILEGIDMEALSPLDANANLKGRHNDPVAKATGDKQLQRQKDHPADPPERIIEPPSPDRPDGAVYIRTGNRPLGKGGFAICWEGELEGTRKKFALKIVKTIMPQKKMEQKFQTELQIHSKMNHANIVQFHRAFSFEASTYIVLELCPRGSLMDMVKKRKFLTEPEVRFYTVQIAGAIKYMHAKGIIHRDLKMGNIFLDKNMNVKVGDFGLAALLISGKDMNAVRRTTLCGTPNYIAPEILEKGKKGHDNAVDIWSLGIIIFAMLTGRPPFQSSTQEEIYRKARERDYDWPALDKSENFISQDAKDLVATLLQDPEERPQPDLIVQHDFFSHGWVPQVEEMKVEFCDIAPHPNHFVSSGLRVGRKALYMKNLKKLCIKSEVGPFNYSQKVYTNTYKEVTAEEKAGLTPAVPLPHGIVYRPFEMYLAELAASLERARARDGNKENTEPAMPAVATTSRAMPQSFAAQQRAQHQPISLRTMAEALEYAPSAVGSSKRAPFMPPSEELPFRIHDDSEPVKFDSTTTKGKQKEEEIPDQVTLAKARLGAKSAFEITRAHAERKSKEPVPLVPSQNRESLFGPNERSDLLPGTDPEKILQGLKSLHSELERALNSRSVGPLKETPPTSPTIVVKWVDYTNKFGLGYILSNGSVGCIFKALPPHNDQRLGLIPPTCLVVYGAELHLQKRQDPLYEDRLQLVPLSGSSIEFYEHDGVKGISHVAVDPKTYEVALDFNGEPKKLSRGKDEWDDRRREKIVLWRKFGNYMTAFGRDQDFLNDHAVLRNPTSAHAAAAAGIVVTFYQRFGDVGCWGFGDGRFQFNFPDHTKLVISADGRWCDFYHLPVAAAYNLVETGKLALEALDQRQHLSYSVQALLNFTPRNGKGKLGTRSTRGSTRDQIDPEILPVPEANDFRRKIEFIVKIIGEWITRGGLGNSDMSPEKRLRWDGYREQVNVAVPYKHVWVSVGARGGDDRRVAWFDPKKPLDIVPDIETL